MSDRHMGMAVMAGLEQAIQDAKDKLTAEATHLSPDELECLLTQAAQQVDKNVACSTNRILSLAAIVGLADMSARRLEHRLNHGDLQ